MTSHSARGLRGWVYVCLLAGIITWALMHVESLSLQRGPSYFQADRATRHVAARVDPTPPQNFATEEIGIEDEATASPSEDMAWLQYRRQTNQDLQSQASLQDMDSIPSGYLMAPVASPIDNLTQSDPNANASKISLEPEESNPTFHVTSSAKATDKPFAHSGHRVPHVSIPGITKKGWPISPGFLSQLQQWSTEAQSMGLQEGVAWGDRVSDLLRRLMNIDAIQDTANGLILQELTELAASGLRVPIVASTLDGSTIQERQRRLAYALERRVLVWQAIHQCTRNSPQHFVAARTLEGLDRTTLIESIEKIRAQLRRTGDQANWEAYLVLPTLESILRNQGIDSEELSRVAQIYLSRVTWQRTSDAQREFMASEPVQRLAEMIQPFAYDPVDYPKLLTEIEAIEDDSIHRSRRTVAEALQSLRFGNSDDQVQLAKAINTHYRNANLRFAVARELLQRCLPKTEVVSRPVRQSILGADTRGASQIATKLDVRLIPDKSAWNLELLLSGNVLSNTSSQRGPATFYNASNALVDTKRTIRVGTHGYSVQGDNTNVDSQDRLRGFATDFDGIPFFGGFIREIVRDQFDQQRSIAQRIVQRNIASQTDTEFDRQLSTQVAQAEQLLRNRLLQPMNQLKLQPTVVDMQTTSQRLVARYRVAGQNQMAAFTPRPLAPSDSWLSIQLHESLMNNTIEQIGLGSRDWTLPELCRTIADAFQQSDWQVPAEIPTDVMIRFAEHRPITIELRDSSVMLTLRVAELRKAGVLHLERFIIRQNYVPSISELSAHLEREGPVSIDAPHLSLGKKLEVRGVFSRIFAGYATLPLVSPSLAKDPRVQGLAVSQLEIRDGWIAFAVSPRDSAHVSLLRQAQAYRVQRSATRHSAIESTLRR